MFKVSPLSTNSQALRLFCRQLRRRGLVTIALSLVMSLSMAAFIVIMLAISFYSTLIKPDRLFRYWV